MVTVMKNQPAAPAWPAFKAKLPVRQGAVRGGRIAELTKRIERESEHMSTQLSQPLAALRQRLREAEARIEFGPVASAEDELALARALALREALPARIKTLSERTTAGLRDISAVERGRDREWSNFLNLVAEADAAVGRGRDVDQDVITQIEALVGLQSADGCI